MLKKLFVILFLLTGAVHNSWAVLTIEITEGVEGASPIAIVPFAWQGAKPPPQDMAAIISADLQRSGLFSPQAEKDLISRPHQADEVNFTDWRVLNIEHLVVGKIKALPGDEFQIQFQLMDVSKGTQIAGYSIRSRRAGLRRTAHKISDIIYKVLTGTPGAFDTLIAYVTVQQYPSGQRKYRLAVADSDGYDEQIILESSQPLMSPSWSPDGKQLAYVSFRNGRPEIFIQNIITREIQKLTSFKGLNSAPAWSPDGKRLALTLSRDGNPEIYLLEIASKRLTRVTRNYAIDTEPAWLPDGKALVFTSDRGGSPQLYKVEVGQSGTTGRVERLTFDGNYNARASVSPDGQHVALVHRVDGRFRIAVLDMQNGQLNIITDSRLDESPSFSANGRMIIYATEDNYRGILAAVSVDGRAHQRLSSQTGDVREPAWSSFKSQ
jgi:TolB protein